METMGLVVLGTQHCAFFHACIVRWNALPFALQNKSARPFQQSTWSTCQIEVCLKVSCHRPDLVWKNAPSTTAWS
jgi:hypothetical protein